MNLIDKFLSEELIQAISWTIVHSLWQGVIIAFILVVLLRILKRHTARIRYFMSSMALLLIFGLSVITFINIHDKDQIIRRTDISESSVVIFHPDQTETRLIDMPENAIILKPSMRNHIYQYFSISY